ncbi:hypothetical protein, partial [Proteiniphilum sp. UBA5510]|uniref:hypothetical protein n=1 Tax=Proteiniphilum sp. UBA5510 TaxID=1947286 RepID=UPI00257E89E3
MNNLTAVNKNLKNIILFFSFLCLNLLLVTPSYGQNVKEKNITFYVKNGQLVDVLNKISRQTSFKFFYDQSTLRKV